MAPQLPELLANLRARDPGALREVVDHHARRIYRAARGMGFSASDAEDLTQEVFVTFMETLDRFEGRATVSTWLFGILLRKAQERRRSLVRERQIEPVDDGFESRFDVHGAWIRPPIPIDRLVESSQAAVALSRCLDGLPEAQRDVFQLRQVEGLSAAEVGDIVGCTVNHVGVLFHRARVRLRACLEEKGWGRSR